jgi:hypothetical protein
VRSHLAASWRSGGRGSAGAGGGDRALLEHPLAEPGGGRPRGHAQPQQPQRQAAERGQEGELGHDGAGYLRVPAGDGAGADAADQGVAGERVHGRGHRPHGEVPPAGRGRDHVHEHRPAGRRGVQQPRPDRPAPGHGQGDAKAGEHQRRRVRDRRFQERRDYQVPGGVDQAVLSGVAHDRGRGRQDAQAGGCDRQPELWSVGAGAGVLRPGRRGDGPAYSGRLPRRGWAGERCLNFRCDQVVSREYRMAGIAGDFCA